MTNPRPLALVTGGVRRVGLAIARALAHAGCDVIITFRSSRDQADSALGAIAAHAPGATLSAEHLALGDLAAVEAFAQRHVREHARLDVLVHNASLYEPTPTELVTPAELEGFMRVNALAPLLLSRAFAPLLSQSSLPGGGSIVTMCDVHALGESGRPRRGFVAYSMSKAALLEMTLVLARELAPRVRVNAVAPGVVAFPDTGPESDPGEQAKYLSRVPLGRAGTPDDAAQAVRWLALDATYCTGQVIRVDGGRGVV